jgi:hypothetical protein
MQMHPEIKEFTKNTLIFTLFFTLVLHLSWGYVAPYFWTRASAGNDANFTQTNMKYMGNIATAFSLNISRGASALRPWNTIVTEGDITVAEALANPRDAQVKLIGNNTIAIQSYVNLLKTDIPVMLDNASNRAEVLDEHIEILKSYYTRTTERLAMIAEQWSELEKVIGESAQMTESAKATMESKYKAFEYVGVDGVIDDYVRAKTEESRARAYLAYVERFQRGYAILQAHNKKILDTLINNRNAIIKKTVVVIPDSGSELVKKLNLVTTEADYKAWLSE